MTHPAQFEYFRDSKIFPLPEGHGWVCNASLPSWPNVMAMWQSLLVPSIFLCIQCVQKYGLREPPMRTAVEEADRASAFCQQLEDLVVERGSVAIGPGQNRDKLLLGYWSVAFDLNKSIIALIHHKFYAGAFALIRSLIETQLRAHIVIMGSDADIALIASDDYQVNFKTIGIEIDKCFGMKGYTERFLDRARDVLHSFTHSGLSQLGRRFEGNDLVANYDDEELIELIYVATTSVVLVNSLVTKYFKFEREWEITNHLIEEWGKPH